MTDIPDLDARRNALARQIAEDRAPSLLPEPQDYDRASSLLLRHFDQDGITYLIPSDDNFPTRLRYLDSEQPVRGLWVRGDAWLPDLLDQAVTITGSRSATAYGGNVASDLAQGVAVNNTYTVIAGASYGIDQAAQRGALVAGGQALAVLATGVDRAYPRGHAPLLEEIAKRGCIVSEVPPGETPTRQRFLNRGRIMAALGDATLIVEASPRSGAINVAEWARRLRLPVGAVPGPVTSATSQGAHELIRAGHAQLIDGREALLDMLEGLN